MLGPAGSASEALSDTNLTGVTLQVNGKGEALITYTRAGGDVRHVLVWGAINALPPSTDTPQVHFSWDYAGGWGRYHNGDYWKTFKNACAPYDGPALPYFVTACKAPDGSYWALQSWQRKLPHRGYPPWKAEQSVWSFDVSHWSGDVAQLELYDDWPFSHETEGLFGRLTYAGVAVHGFRTTRSGVPTDGYGRALYIDTLDSSYGPGWRRETSIVFRNPTGSFCYSFWPTRDASLPGAPERPPGTGGRYRISTMGPGVTPDLAAEVDGLGVYDRSDPNDVALQRGRVELYDQLTAGDKFCVTQR